MPSYQVAEHHRTLAESLERVANGECKRLMVFMPPRHGKSQLTSMQFPAWFIGRHPEKEIICASYAQELAAHFGREVRNLVSDPEFESTFGVTLAPDSTAKHRWNTNIGGSYVAAGVGGSITGRGAHLLVIDDPVKNREDADSEIYREKVWDWYRSTAFTRLMPGGAVVLVMTRWHDDDLAGRLLEHDGDQWEVITLKAIEDDKPLWPEWYNIEALEQIRSTVGPREWSALYQQSPTPDEGDYFKREWIQWYDEAPQYNELAIYGASDYAVTDGGGDYTVHGVIGVDHEDNIYLLDWWKGQTASDEWVNIAISMMRQWNPRKWAEENGQIIKSIGPFLEQRMREKGVYCVREQYASAVDKATRARAIQARLSMGKVFFPKGKQWAHNLMDEMVRFPAGTHDDQVDVLSLFGRMLGEMIGGMERKRDEKPRGLTFEDLERNRQRINRGRRSIMGAPYARSNR
jgi:predicted phage terminase large subunit-like protein